jgi:hypothetical protein
MSKFEGVLYYLYFCDDALGSRGCVRIRGRLGCKPACIIATVRKLASDSCMFPWLFLVF